MKEHQTIFSIKDLKIKVKNAFVNGIPNRAEKLKIIENWQENIISGKVASAKEEELKPLFITQVFGDVLGYEYQNATDWNLRLENKSSLDNSKADAALGFFKIIEKQELNKDVRVVIEIKDARTTLDKPQNRTDFKGSPVEQCFMYAAKSGEKCKWVVVSNFLEIRLYLSNDMTKYESFDILSLTDNYEFSKFYFLLADGQLFYSNIASTIDNFLANRQEKEKTITKEFYEKYQYLREVFLQHLKLHNPDKKPLDLLQYAQTIIDRVIFVSVIKDYDLIQTNVLRKIENIAEESFAGDKEELWRQLKSLFKAIDEGLPPRIQKFNGGLFRKDEVIENLKIKDIFLKQLLTLGNYDFESDLNVNILGHIFEQSITDIENIKKDISENKKFDYSESDYEIIYKSQILETNKRKKQGIYYTPERITEYIVSNTVGQWLQKQKENIGITQLTEYPTNPEERNRHSELWEKYKIVLRRIKILDPACGSGAFLTQAFDFLLHEWLIVLDAQEKLRITNYESRIANKIGLFANAPNENAGKISQIKKEIVNNNLFGVDLNHESVEITKLGLWLKSASKDDALALLDTNIKCGNSLIADKSVSGKAFDWKTEFSEIIEHGGFDIIIGNPPYVDIKQLPNEDVNYFFENYQTTENRINLYSIFIEKAVSLLNPNGILSFINPNSMLVNSSYLKIRTLLFKGIDKIVKMPDNVFPNANVETIIFSYLKNTEVTFAKAYIFPHKQQGVDLKDIKYQIIDKKNWNGKTLIFNIYTNNRIQEIIKKCYENSELLGSICDFSLGITPYDKYKGHSEDLIKNREFHSITQKDETYKPLIKGENICRYFISEENSGFIKYGNNLGAARQERFFTEPRIIVRQIISGNPPAIFASFTDKHLYFTQIGFSIIPKNEDYNVKYLLSILNSKLINFIHKYRFTDLEKEVFQKILIENCKLFPIPKIPIPEQLVFVELVDKMLEYQKQVHKLKNNFIELVISELKVEKISNKLEDWNESTWNEFTDELKKAKIKLGMNELNEWKAFFTAEKSKVQNYSSQISFIDNEINRNVYKLYNLDESEFQYIENQ